MITILRIVVVFLFTAFVVGACQNPFSPDDPVPPNEGNGDDDDDDDDQQTGAVPPPPIYFA